MKKTIKNSTLFLAGITVTGFLLFGPGSFAGGDQKEKQTGKPWPCPEKYSKMVNPLKPDAGILAAGKEVWENHCKSCHGKTGRGDGVKSKNLDITCGDFSSDEYQNKSDGELFWRVTEGRKPMPHNKDKISDIERWSVILYTRTFAKKTEAAEALKRK
jgi:mono/diheme cytochrome c family protein